jgi:4-amino-4-deoxy-L-arabinose transferase-like glycosyltransferase
MTHQPPERFSDSPALALRGPTCPWSAWQWAVLAALFLAGLWMRLHALSAEGFADDEIHKWLAANRYLHGDFGGDDIEHPMLMKWCITGSILLGRALGWAPERMVRLPCALAGALCILSVAWVGRRLFGRFAGLSAAGLTALSTTFIGYNRVAKEDAFVAFFATLMVLCVAEAKAAADDGRTTAQRRWEVWGAVLLGVTFASKYFFFFCPIPPVAYLWLRSGGSAWYIPLRRWAGLIGIAFAVFAALNWIPLLPSSWAYQLAYFAEKKTIHGALFFMGHIFHNLPWLWLRGTPPWFYEVFWGVKHALPMVLLSAIGLVLAVWRRAPSHRVLLTWLGFPLFALTISGSKWGRFFESFFPCFALLAGYAAAAMVRWVRTRAVSPWQPVTAGLVLLLVPWAAEARAALTHAPHYRLYVSMLGGGDRNLDWFFPHCDYFDAGFREAVQAVAVAAEPGAELVSEIDWLARYYAERFGRPDLVPTMLRPDEACRAPRVCYVVVQTGRLYFQNEEAVRALAQRRPWHIERVLGHEVVKVYRLSPGESPFPTKAVLFGGH